MVSVERPVDLYRKPQAHRSKNGEVARGVVFGCATLRYFSKRCWYLIRSSRRDTSEVLEKASPLKAVGTAGLKDALRQCTQPQGVGSVLFSEERRKMHRCSTKP